LYRSSILIWHAKREKIGGEIEQQIRDSGLQLACVWAP